jgi:beta-N-acetylhexosaminidase
LDNFGQTIFTGITGTSLSKEEIDFIQKENIGGIVLTSQNFQDPGQLAELVNSIQKLRDEYPLFISLNHEDGRTNRFKNFFTQFPAMLELSKLNSPKLIFEVHEVIAKELKACGINLCFSPSCDILTNSDNKQLSDISYGTDAQTVEKFISATIRGLQTNGILSCAKHFPGHGETSKDSRVDLPLIKRSVTKLKERELIPFTKAVKSRVEFMMMGHLLVEEIDPHYPTSLSSKAYEFLRQETKFTKLVMTDDLDSKAITDRFSPEEAAFLCMKAGADIILDSSLENARKCLLSIRESVKKKLINKEQMIERVLRIEKCKKEFLSNYSPIYIPKISESFNSQEAKKILDHFHSVGCK